MDYQLEKMITMLKLWLKKNRLGGDTFFYTIEEWRRRNEPYLNDSEFVIVSEGGLNFILNWGDSSEFYDLIESFGYYCELGHSWNLGFYKDEWSNHDNVAGRTYSQKLRDPRWVKKRDAIRSRAENKCEDCQSANYLQIHHCYYVYGCEPWEYPADSLRCLCSDCHQKRDLSERILRGHLASLKKEELDSLIELIENGLHWYPKDEVFDLLRSFKYDQTDMKKIFNKILDLRTNNSK